MNRGRASAKSRERFTRCSWTASRLIWRMAKRSSEREMIADRLHSRAERKDR